MKTRLLFLTILLFSTNLFAQDYELSNKLIFQFESAKQKSLNKSAKAHDHLWLTPLLAEAHRNWNVLSEEAKNLFKSYLSRPTFAGTEKIATYGNFAFHYTIDGPSGESVNATDSNSNGIPDYIENMAHLFGDDVYNLYHTQTSLTIPPYDGDEYNGAYFDIYISGTEAGSGTYGYVSPEETIGDNPNSLTLTELDASTSHMVMRNNYSGFPGSEQIAISVTAAHEYMHATQFGYSETMDSWFMEACATWAEEYTFPGYDDNFQYLMDIFGKTDVALNLKNGESPDLDNHWYSSWLFIKYITEHSSNSIIKSIYENCIDYYAVDAIDAEFITNWNSTFNQQFNNFVIANVVMDNTSLFEPFTYKRAPDYVTEINNKGGFGFEHSFNYVGTSLSFTSHSNGNNRLMRLSSDYFLLESNQNFKIMYKSLTAGSELDFYLIKINETTSKISVQPCVIQGDNAVLNVTDNSAWEYFVPIVIRHDRDVSDINPSDYSLVISNPTITSLDENTESSALSVFPIPARDIINISYNGPIIGNMNFELFDLAGKKVEGYYSENKSCKLETSSLANGVYTLKVTKNGASSIYKKVIISH